MKVKWTDNAVAHLVNIYEYISLNSPTYAKQMVNKIPADQCKLLQIHYLAEKYPNMTVKLSGN